MARYDNNNRQTPDAVQNYNLQPVANAVDKQARYTPQLSEASKLKATAEGLSRLAKGVSDITPYIMETAEKNITKAAAEAGKNKQEWADVSKHIKGMAKFNPYNKEVFNGLRSKEITEASRLKLYELNKNSAMLTSQEFDQQVSAIMSETVQAMNAEGLKAKHTAGYLTTLQNEINVAKRNYVSQNADYTLQMTKNKVVTSTARDMAGLTSSHPDGFISGWDEAVKSLTDTANGLGWNNVTQAELFMKTVNQFLIDNIDEVDAEDFMIAVSQTKINGQPLSDFDPNYAETMKTMLKKAKLTKFEMDKLELDIEKHRLEKVSLDISSEMFKVMKDPNVSDAEVLNKLTELIEANDAGAMSSNLLRHVSIDKNNLLALRTVQSKPDTVDGLLLKEMEGSLTVDDINTALVEQRLSPKDAYGFTKRLQQEISENLKTTISELDSLYVGNNAVYNIPDNARTDIIKGIAEIKSSNATEEEKLNAVKRLRNAAKQSAYIQELNMSSNPQKLLTAEYMKSQRIPEQTTREAQRYLSQLGFLQNQAGGTDTNINVSSTVQKERDIVTSEGLAHSRPHYGTDVATSLGRSVHSIGSGNVVASGYEDSMGNYLLVKMDSGKYVKLMHLQEQGLAKTGTRLKYGDVIGYVGNTGDVTTKSSGVLHVELFDERMRLMNPKQYIKGR